MLYLEDYMVRKLLIIACILLINFGIITNYIDSGRVTTGQEPKYVLKFIGSLTHNSPARQHLPHHNHILTQHRPHPH